jgi:hypothetical protein
MSEWFACSDSSSVICIVLAVADASGRYVPSFFWGNSYWTGSESLCYHLNSNASRLEAVPFRLGFYTVRLQISLPQYISPGVSTRRARGAQPLIALFCAVATRSYQNVRISLAMSVCPSPCNNCRVVEFRFFKSGIWDLTEICRQIKIGLGNP